jgi:hypothetical protein
VRSIEERLRGTFREVAEEIPGDSVPPLILPDRRRRAWFTREAPPPAAGRARAWAAVASSAAMVAAVIGAAAGLGTVLRGPQPGSAATVGAASAPAGVALAAAGVPRYYVALTAATVASRRFRPRTRASAVVRATTTGATIATVVPPRPFDTFTMVTAARDDRTFVLAAQRFAPVSVVRLFVLRLHPARRTPARRAELSPLPVPYLEKGGRAWGLALSPDGRQLAVSVGADAPREVQVVNLATGAQHAWTGTVVSPGIGNDGGWLSWAADERTLAVAGTGTVRLLDTSAPGNGLLADSEPVASVGTKFWPQLREVVMTPDEQALVAVRQATASRRNGHGLTAVQELVRLSTATGQPTAVLNELPVRQGAYEQVLWTSASGRKLIVTGTQPGASAGILTGRQFTPIPWSSGVLTAAW